MKRIYSRPLARLLVLVLCLSLGAPAGYAAAQCGCRAKESRAETAAAATERPQAGEAKELTPEEEAELSARSEEPGDDVVGGALSNTHLTYIVIALAAAVIVLIAK